MTELLSQVVRPAPAWGFVEVAVALVIILAVCGLVAVFCRVSGFTLPTWVWQVIGIVVAAVVVIVAIRFVASM
jgi:hypothetical protein